MNKFYSLVRRAFIWALLDIKCRYRRSTLGPFWETINVAVLIAGITLISSAVIGNPSGDNLGYIGLGVILWTAISGGINEAPGLLLRNREMIFAGNTNVPLYVWRQVFGNLLAFGHHAILYFIGLIFGVVALSPAILVAPIGLLFIYANVFWISHFLGLVGARYRDIELIVRNFVQISFFMTPIFWDYRVLGPERAYVIEYNVFFYFLESVRQPLMGQVPSLKVYLILSVVTALGFALTAVCDQRMRRRIGLYV